MVFEEEIILPDEVIRDGACSARGLLEPPPTFIPVVLPSPPGAPLFRFLMIGSPDSDSRIRFYGPGVSAPY